MKKLVTATVAAAVALLVADYLVDMVPLIGNNHPHGHAENSAFSTWGILGALGHGVVLAVVMGWRGVADAMDGMKGGATYGLLLSVASLSGRELSVPARLTIWRKRGLKTLSSWKRIMWPPGPPAGHRRC
jgi:hypothetical protein